MSLLDIFSSPEKRKGKSHLKNLMAMAMADGKLEDVELKFLTKIASRYGISTKELEGIRINVSKNPTFSFEKDSSKFEQIYDLIKMMMIDDEINPKELKMCKKYAEKIGYQSTKVDEIIESVVQNISNGNSLEETRTRLAYLIKD